MIIAFFNLKKLYEISYKQYDTDSHQHIPIDKPTKADPNRIFFMKIIQIAPNIIVIYAIILITL